LYQEMEREMGKHSEGGMKGLCREVRKLIQQLSAETGVPIEPPTSTPLLDRFLALDYISYAAVPGGKKPLALTL